MKTMISKFDEAQEIEARSDARLYAILGTKDENEIDAICLMDKFIEQFKTRTQKRLRIGGIFSDEDLTSKTESEIQTITNNKKCLNEIQEYLSTKGLRLLMPSEKLAK